MRRANEHLYLLPIAIAIAGLGSVSIWRRATNQRSGDFGLFAFDSHRTLCTAGERATADASDQSRKTDHW